MLILASKSPRRVEILKNLGFTFKCSPTDVDEAFPNNLKTSKVAGYLAELKANAAFLEHPNDVVLASDTIVVFKNKIFGKPTSTSDARNMLSVLSGKKHIVYTGVSIKSSEKSVTFTQKTYVYFEKISQEEINNYIASGEPIDKAGAYAIQGKGSKFVKKIKGDYYTVMGLPAAKVYKKLKEFEKMGDK